MWGLVCHRGLWGMFREDGDSTATPFLHPQGCDLQKAPQRPALAFPPCSLLVPLATSQSQGLAGIPGPCEQAKFHRLPKMLQPQRTPLPQFGEAP